MTYAELLKISPLDDLWHELIDGEHIARGGAWLDHQTVLQNLAMIVWKFLDAHPVGKALHRPLDVVLSECNVLQPDLFFVSNARREIWTKDNVQGAPDLMVEVLDDESRRRDEIHKRGVYERFGVTEYWLGDSPAEAIKRYVRGESERFERPTLTTRGFDESFTTPLLPGLTIDLA